MATYKNFNFGLLFSQWFQNWKQWDLIHRVLVSYLSDTLFMETKVSINSPRQFAFAYWLSSIKHNNGFKYKRIES